MGKKLIIIGADFSDVAVNADEKLYMTENLDITVGSFVDADGVIHNDNSNFGLTEYIDVEWYKNFRVPYSFTAVAAGYDENQNLVQTFSTENNYPETEQNFVLIDTVKYIRVNKREISPIEFYVLLY